MRSRVLSAEIIAKVQYGLKITFIFVALLFVDAVNQMLKIHREKETLQEQGAVRQDLRSETDYRSRKFLAERNFYLHGFTLFLSLILSRTYSLVLDLIKAQEDLAILKQQVRPLSFSWIVPSTTTMLTLCPDRQAGHPEAKEAVPAPGDKFDPPKKKVEMHVVDKKND
ncbi:SPOSA6832_03541 [Sporobolomyces salmonicolor]|uniref:Endoplasmic reticulum transmembrane protein n=1 Tax=Sporidiobolus salmonicolor TaxID=5005 RepID=A0A0D6EQA8_SPOSA|nr:SPOSA6832_03541 [Sporobolomyces salmonicolor]